MLFEITEPAAGAENMRRDELLLAGAATAPPTLRLYRWSCTTLSLGYGQALSQAADPAALSRLGIPWVRRPTGGRALLHQPDELTYAFAAGRQLAPRLRTAYARVMRAIRQGLAAFISLDPPRGEPAPAGGFPARLPCLAVASGHELTVDGRKLVAGAQRWRRTAFLQHGSIPWTVDRRRTNEAAGLPPDSQVHAVGLAELASAGEVAAPRVETVARALSTSFAQEFGEGRVVVCSAALDHALDPASVSP